MFWICCFVKAEHAPSLKSISFTVQHHSTNSNSFFYLDLMSPVADHSPLILPCLQHSQSLSPKLAQILVHVCVCAHGWMP